MNVTNDPNLTSWIDSANEAGCDFPIQNLPFGLFTVAGDDRPRIGVAIGDKVMDCGALGRRGLLDDHCEPAARDALASTSLNDFLALGRAHWRAVRERMSALLRSDMPVLKDDMDAREACFFALSEVELHLPMDIGDYTDFYASLSHATNIGSMFRPDNPLMPNWKHLPVGYHGRASSIVVSGTPIVRPAGQTIAADGADPTDGNVRLLDYELEVAFVMGPGNTMGDRIEIESVVSRNFRSDVAVEWVHAPICRDELLVEIEGLAVVPE